ncbi:2-oxoglutarate-Fe(II) type oxidoreductase hxnY-like isoform X1 [Telopea speciosissima]|uniref:2-oxoglutarate-Fe(II) type oxidoreductase hxnY-like isoform X1 n=1 Tax=Telopea speciosissima TaxID=54955 RepID=UPI001CC63339|nr:2-oxoglutarate-Fe(II) type oxidoreductase hxnY-like isoform X1 [Telopea speciosissima]
MGETLKLPIIDLSSTDRLSTATTIRRACVDFGFFYLANHGVEEEFLKRVFEESKMLFSLPLEQKMKLARKENRGYSPFYAEKLDTSLNSRGDLKESFHIGPIEGTTTLTNLNQWPSEEALPSWKLTMESYYQTVLNAGKSLVSLIALALNLEENFFEKLGALDAPMPFVRLLHYPGELAVSNEETYGASAHSDYGMITLLATDGVRGLQICREKYRQPQVWEDVQHVNGAFIVNIGDMMERWTNCLFRSTLHRVIPAGQERYSVAFFLDPNSDCMIECLESCCSEKFPPRFPPIRSGDYLQERFRVTYSSQ